MIKLGIECLLESQLDLLHNRRVGLVTHNAAVMPDLTHILDALWSVDAPLTALFAPEHGLSGAAVEGEKVGDTIDPRSGLPIYSLYGAEFTPSEAMLDAVDLFLFDMQDVGCRYFTYLSTLHYLLRTASQHHKSVIVLDRPNPITGTRIEGALLPAKNFSFVGIAALPNRHGLTLGEAALWLNRGEAFPPADLQVIAMQGWRRSMWFDQTGLYWVPASPAMAHLSAVTLYPGSCLLEGINVTLGRASALPFEVCAAPWLDGNLLAETMNRLGLPGIRFRPHSFIPFANVYAGQLCHGVQMHVTDRDALQPLHMGLELIAMIRHLFGEQMQFSPHFDRLAGEARAKIEASESLESLAQEPEGYRASIQKFYLYE
ncbi:MAG: DUF1343 domain-containing protein [Caldilineaceae bacterium]